MTPLHFNDVVFFCLGWLVRAILFGIVAEMVVRPLVRYIVREAQQENSALQHYLNDHEGRSYQCPVCKPALS